MDLKILRSCKEQRKYTPYWTPGVGKTHLAVSIAIEAANHGYSTYFINFYDLMSQLKKHYWEIDFKQS